MFAVPAVVDENVVEHVAVPSVALATRLHGLGVNETPLAIPVWLKVTAPVGVMAVPAVEVSITVAVQTEAWFTATGLGQLTLVVVVRGFTMTLAAVVVELPL